MKLSGYLSDLGLSEILNVVGAARRSGMLRLSLDTLDAIVVFRAGVVVGLQHPDIPQTLTALASRAGSDRPTDPGARVWLTDRIEAVTRALLSERHGTFEFVLVDSPADLESESGPLLLEEGIPHSRLLAAVPRASNPSIPGGTPQTRPTRPVMSELAIDLTASAARAPASPPAAEPAAATAEDTVVMNVEPAPSTHRLLVLALATGELRRQIARHARAAGWEVREPASPEEVELALESSLRHGHAVALIAQATSSTLPGLELVAYLKSLDRRAACVLLLESGADASRLGPLRARATNLGTNIVALVPHLGGSADAEELAIDLLEHVSASVAPIAMLSRTVPLGPEASGPDLLWSSLPDARERPAIDLSTLAAACAASRHSSEAALAILSAAAEHFERGVLLLRDEAGLLPVAAIIPHGDRPPASLVHGERLAIGDDVVSRAASTGARFVGDAPADHANLQALQFLGAERPLRIAALPLMRAGACFAVLYGDDAGDAEAQPDLAAFLRFIDDAAPSLHAALAVSASREQARKARLSA